MTLANRTRATDTGDAGTEMDTGIVDSGEVERSRVAAARNDGSTSIGLMVLHSGRL